jgi:hypothetical protein
VNVPVQCRLLDSSDFWGSKPVAGEMKDIGLGGAQVWLPRRFPRFKEISVSMILDGKAFHARAEIVSLDLESKTDPKSGFHRHGLRWVSMEAKVQELLADLISRQTKS